MFTNFPVTKSTGSETTRYLPAPKFGKRKKGPKNRVAKWEAKYKIILKRNRVGSWFQEGEYYSTTSNPKGSVTDIYSKFKYPSGVNCIAITLQGVGYAFSSLNTVEKDDVLSQSVLIMTGGVTSTTISVNNIPNDGTLFLLSGKKNPKKQLIVYGSQAKEVIKISERICNIKPYNLFTRQGIKASSIQRHTWDELISNSDIVFKSTILNSSASLDSLETVHENPSQPSDFKFVKAFPKEVEVGIDMPWGQNIGENADSTNLSKTLFWVDALGEKEKEVNKRVVEYVDRSHLNDTYDPTVLTAQASILSNTVKTTPVNSLRKKIEEPMDYEEIIEDRHYWKTGFDYRRETTSKDGSWSPLNYETHNPSEVNPLRSPMEQLQSFKDNVNELKMVHQKDNFWNATNKALDSKVKVSKQLKSITKRTKLR